MWPACHSCPLGCLLRPVYCVAIWSPTMISLACKISTTKRTFHRAINAVVVTAWAFIHAYHSRLMSAYSNTVFSPLQQSWLSRLPVTSSPSPGCPLTHFLASQERSSSDRLHLRRKCGRTRTHLCPLHRGLCFCAVKVGHQNRPHKNVR